MRPAADSFVDIAEALEAAMAEYGGRPKDQAYYLVMRAHTMAVIQASHLRRQAAHVAMMERIIEQRPLH